MKRHWITTFVTCLTLALLAGALVAEEAKDRPDKPERRRRAGRRGGGPRRMPDVGLTDAQKKEIEGIRKDAMAKIKDAEPKERREIHKKMREDIAAVLTAEQKEKMKKARQRGGSDRPHPDIGLSDEQKAKIDTIRKEARAAAKDAKGADRRAIYQKMQKDINALLTDEQKEKMKKARQRGRRGRGMPDIGLSEEQKAKIEAIRKDARAASKDKKGEERKAIYQKMQKDINALLTDEQREKLKKARQGGPRGRGRRGRGGDRRPRKKAADK